MSKFLSLLVVALFAFDVSLVAARPQYRRFHEGHSSTPVDVQGLDTNTKRLAAGLPPFPPVVRRRPSGVEAARRAVSSQCAKSGVIEVVDTNGGSILQGYVSNLQNGQRYGLSDLNNAATFTSSVFTSGKTTSINLRDVSDGTHFLAGLIQKGRPLGDGPGFNQVAVLGRSFVTNPGDPPQGNRDPSFNNRDAETAIWTYDRTDDSLTATWVNYFGQQPATTTAFISYASGDRFFLTNSATAPPSGIPVLFHYISRNDQCSG